MKEITYKCDHCKKKITEDKDYVEAEVQFLGDIWQCDLCSKCVEELQTLLTEYSHGLG